MIDRRLAERKPFEIFFNKYLRGHPYLCRSIDLSSRGVSAMTFCEPEEPMESLPLELRVPGSNDSVWVWARGVWRSGHRQALEFVSVDACDERRLEKFLSSLAA